MTFHCSSHWQDQASHVLSLERDFFKSSHGIATSRSRSVVGAFEFMLPKSRQECSLAMKKRKSHREGAGSSIPSRLRTPLEPVPTCWIVPGSGGPICQGGRRLSLTTTTEPAHLEGYSDPNRPGREISLVTYDSHPMLMRKLAEEWRAHHAPRTTASKGEA